VLTIALCLAFAATPVATAIAALYAALPSSASAYVMARQMGGNAPILAGMITLTTIGAVVSIPAIMTLLNPEHACSERVKLAGFCSA
jgi:predicted permease